LPGHIESTHRAIGTVPDALDLTDVEQPLHCDVHVGPVPPLASNASGSALWRYEGCERRAEWAESASRHLTGIGEPEPAKDTSGSAFHLE
jgi:hypothetical protein